ncbi:MAG: hypothetical protein K6F61_01350 [Clostridiales bacterium]|nr:hypothetical protein [Clostridiales bacterium]
MMDNKLKQLFGYQRFEENRDLQQVIDSVHAKYAKRELTLDDLEMVNAAGVSELPDKRKDGEDK